MSVAQDLALRLAAQIEHALDDTRAITAPLDRPELGGTDGENADHASIFLGIEHVEVSFGRVAVRKPGAHEPKMPNVCKFRATKPRIDALTCPSALKSRSYPLANPWPPTPQNGNSITTHYAKRVVGA